MKPGRDVTKAAKVLEYLREHEFSRRKGIAEALKLPVDTVSSVLNSLWRYKAVDVVIEADGVGWWFATPETDQRTRVTLEQKTDIRRRSAPKHRAPATRKAVRS